MTGEIREVSTKPKKIYNDERFDKIFNQAREIKGLLRELNEMAYCKFDDLLGACPSNMDKKSMKASEMCWAERVLNEQRIAMEVCRDTLERLSAV